MTPFKIKWTYLRLPPWPEDKIQRLKTLYFDNAARRWAYVLKGWPVRTDGKPLELPGNRLFTEIEVLVSFEYFRQDVADAVARVPPAMVQRLKPSQNQPWNFPFMAALNIDLNDLTGLMNDRARFFDTVVHELGHILGLGMRWADDDVPNGPFIAKQGSRDLYVGRNACRAYAELKAVPPGKAIPGIPLDTEYEGSTPAFHWGEDVLQFEIMSPTLDSPTVSTLPGGGSNVISAISVAALQDLGYLVDMKAVEALPSASAAAKLAATACPCASPANGKDQPSA